MRTIDDTGCQTNEIHRDAASPWRKASPPRILRSAKACEALAEIVVSGVEHLRANEACVRERRHEEGVHQMRVASRRLRSALAIFDDLLEAEESGYLTGELKWLINELGPARDWDVFLSETLAAVIAGMPDEKALLKIQDRAEQRREHGYAKAIAAIDSQRYVGLTMLLTAWAQRQQGGGPARTAGVIHLGSPVMQFADTMLSDRYRQVIAFGQSLATMNAERRHKLRIQIKKLRYATEFFSCLYSTRKVAPFVAAMKDLQDDLGASNDVEVARRLIKELSKDGHGKERAQLRYAAGLVIGWHNHVAKERDRKVLKAWEAFTSRPTFWRDVPPSAGEAPQAPVPLTAAEGVSDAVAPVIVATGDGPALLPKTATPNGAGPARVPPAVPVVSPTSRLVSERSSPQPPVATPRH
jgi:CHAD domain-containing protein